MDVFNIESCEGTEELESSLQSQMIGSTMYDKRWVINLVFKICSSPTALHEATLLCDVESLGEMSVDHDVSEFLLSSGSLDILWNQIHHYEDSQSILEPLSLILFNCSSNEGILERFLARDAYFLTPFTLISSKYSPAFLINIFRYLRNLLDKLLALIEELGEVEEDEESEAHSEAHSRLGTLQTIIGDPSIAQQLIFIYSSSSNDQLLLRGGLFLLSLTELLCESGREDLAEDIFSGSDFIISFYEALKQSVSKNTQATKFVFIELLGHYCSPENLMHLAPEVCESLLEVLYSYTGQEENCRGFSSEDLDIMGTLLKIYSTSWNHVEHKDSYLALISLREKLESLPPSEKYIALIENINGTLHKFREKFSNTLNHKCTSK
eukprot:TRINITY_DN7835_c0_g1_i1.p1 TRINITY_DN7835_c0_g1~~TRINITY_DN7835_c0_g1_i1.p1  ORF type:complete len:381 (-),score=81.79 TRINITY_DN7835_c0_g1_i1:83-1225(-)